MFLQIRVFSITFQITHHIKTKITLTVKLYAQEINMNKFQNKPVSNSFHEFDNTVFVSKYVYQYIKLKSCKVLKKGSVDPKFEFKRKDNARNIIFSIVMKLKMIPYS